MDENVIAPEHMDENVIAPKPRKIAIFGGTFDPFTPAHADICRKVLDLRESGDDDQKLIDELYVVPTIVDYYKHDYKKWLFDDQKVEVIKALLDANGHDDRVRIYTRDLELKQMLSSSSAYIMSRRFIDTLVDICHDAGFRKGIDQVFVVIGLDQYKNFKKWSEWEAITAIATLIVVAGRNNEYMPKDYNVPYGKLLCIDPDYADMSATDMRMTFGSSDYVTLYIDKMKEVILKKVNPSLLLHTPIFDVCKGTPWGGVEPVVIKAPDWVTIIVEDIDTGYMLVERQHRFGSNCDIVEFPCGMVEPGESPRDAAIRELREETGYIVPEEKMTYLGSTNPNPAFMTNRMHYFQVKMHGHPELGERELDSHEKIDPFWVSRDRFISRLTEYILDPKETIPAILLSALFIYLKNEQDWKAK